MVVEILSLKIEIFLILIYKSISDLQTAFHFEPIFTY